MLLEGVQEHRGVGTDDLLNLLAVLEDDESRHGADAELLGEVGQMVDVELGEVDVLEGLLLGPPGRQEKEKLVICFVLYVWMDGEVIGTDVFRLLSRARARYEHDRGRWSLYVYDAH